MKIKGEVVSQEIETKSGTASRTGKPYSIREQGMLVELPNGERRRVSVSLEANENPLDLGVYEPGDNAIYFERFGVALSMRARHWRKVDALAMASSGGVDFHKANAARAAAKA